MPDPHQGQPVANSTSEHVVLSWSGILLVSFSFVASVTECGTLAGHASQVFSSPWFGCVTCSHHHSAGNACSWEDLSFNSSTPPSGQLLTRCNMAILLGWGFTCSGEDGEWLIAWLRVHLQVTSCPQDPKTSWVSPATLVVAGQCAVIQVLASTHKVGELAREWSSALLLGEPAWGSF